jgi:hypothetical protein
LITQTRYDDAGEVRAVIRRNAANVVERPEATIYDYDAFGRKTTMTRRATSGIRCS